jgi:hypothetical protein
MKIEEICEGYWKNIDIENQEKSSKKSSKFNIMINGKIWKKNGIPVEFSSQELVDRAVDTITKRYNKTAQPVRI